MSRPHHTSPEQTTICGQRWQEGGQGRGGKVASHPTGCSKASGPRPPKPGPATCAGMPMPTFTGLTTLTATFFSAGGAAAELANAAAAASAAALAWGHGRVGQQGGWLAVAAGQCRASQHQVPAACPRPRGLRRLLQVPGRCQLWEFESQASSALARQRHRRPHWPRQRPTRRQRSLRPSRCRHHGLRTPCQMPLHTGSPAKWATLGRAKQRPESTRWDGPKAGRTLPPPPTQGLCTPPEGPSSAAAPCATRA